MGTTGSGQPGKKYTQIQAFPLSLAINISPNQISSMHLELSNSYAYATREMRDEE
jgi:hypothetical protein